MARPLFLFAALLPLAAQVPDKIDINLDGKPFTTFHAGAAEGRPYLAPIRAASGKIITRHFPMEMVEGESRDHRHHRGLWFSYDDVDGTKFWENDPSYQDPKVGRIVATRVDWKPGSKILETVFNWNDHGGKTLLVEHRTMKFHSHAALRTIDFDIRLTAAEKVVFGDTKEGAFAIRLADGLTEKSGAGKMVSSEGKRGMADIWGKQWNWVDYSGTLEGEKLGIAIFDHPSNPGHPIRWHARDYGLFAVNPWGQHAFDSSAPEVHTSLDAGASIRFRWRVVVHDGDTAAAHIADLYKDFAK